MKNILCFALTFLYVANCTERYFKFIINGLFLPFVFVDLTSKIYEKVSLNMIKIDELDVVLTYILSTYNRRRKIYVYQAQNVKWGLTAFINSLYNNIYVYTRT